MKRFLSLGLNVLIKLFHGANALSGMIAGRVSRFRFLRLDFRPRPEDIFVVSYPRSGTTWLQMIVYQLCTDGDMDFMHISERCPWLERQGASHPLLKQKRPGRRIFKSHLDYGGIPKGEAKYIYIYRDGIDVAVSLFHFYKKGGFRKEFAQFFRMFVGGKIPNGSWFKHVSSWLEHASDPRILCIKYEELKQDPRGAVGRIANFCGVPIDEAKMKRVLERSSLAFMKQHESQFDHVTELLWERGMRLSSFIRSGEAGAGIKHLTEEEAAQFRRELEHWPTLKAAVSSSAQSSVLGGVAGVGHVTG